jgi:hypothetical protein
MRRKRPDRERKKPMIKKHKTALICRAIAIGGCTVLAIVPIMVAAAASDRTSIQRVPMTVSEIGILNINGNSGTLSINLRGAITGPGEETVVGGAYVQYSMIVPRHQKRVLTARLEGTGSIPPGCSLRLRAVPSGRKNEGVSQGSIVLTTDPLPILYDIGSCSTGIGATDGTRLIFTLAGPQPEKTISGEMRTATIILAFI